MRQEEEVIEHMQPRDASRAGYLLRSGYPVYSDTQTTFYPSGEELLPSILEKISKAERFIFLEYFIIEEGEVWSSILKVLAEKAKAGKVAKKMHASGAARTRREVTMNSPEENLNRVNHQVWHL